MSDQSLLSQISSLVTLDVDSMDPAVAQKHLSAKFCGMTSNQGIVHNEAIRPENRALVQRALQYADEQESIGSSRGIQDALDMLVCMFEASDPLVVPSNRLYYSQKMYTRLLQEMFMSRRRHPKLMIRMPRLITPDDWSVYLKRMTFQGLQIQSPVSRQSYSSW